MIKLLSVFNLELRKQVGNTKKIIMYRYLYLLVLAIPATVMCCTKYYGTLDISLDEASSLGYTILLTLGMLQVALVCFFGSEFASESISGERLTGNLDLLRVTAGEKNIIFGKFQACIYLGFLLVTSSFPVITAAYFLGGVTLPQVFASFFVIIFTLFLMNSVGLLFSTVFNKSRHISSLFLIGYLFYCVFSFESHLPAVTFGNAPRAFFEIVKNNDYAAFWQFSVFSMLATLTFLVLSIKAMQKEIVFSWKTVLKAFAASTRPQVPPQRKQLSPGPVTALITDPLPKVPVIKKYDPYNFNLCGYVNPVFIKGLPFFPLRGLKKFGMVMLIIMYVFFMLVFLVQVKRLEDLVPLMVLMPLLAILVAAVEGASSFTDEKKQQIMELFRLISLPSKTVVMGKILASLSLSSLCLLFTAMGAVFFLLVQQDIWALLVIFLMVLVLVYTFFFATLGTFLSLVCRKQRTARSMILLLPLLFAWLGAWSQSIYLSPPFLLLLGVTSLFLSRMPSIVAVPRLRMRSRNILKGLGIVVMIAFAACLASGVVLKASPFRLIQMVIIAPEVGLLTPLCDSPEQILAGIFLALCSLGFHILLSWYLFTMTQSMLESDKEWDGKMLLKALWRGHL